MSEEGQQTDEQTYTLRIVRKKQALTSIQYGNPSFEIKNLLIPKKNPITIQQPLQGSNYHVKNLSYRVRPDSIRHQEMSLPVREQLLKEKAKKNLLRKNMTIKLLKITRFLGNHQKGNIKQ